MKIKKIIKYKFLIAAGVAIVVIIAACKKSFLDKPPIGTLSPELMANEAGVQGILIGAYSMVDGEGGALGGFASGASNWTYGGVASDDAYKGSDPSDVADVAPFEQFLTLTPTNGAVPQKWRVCYAGVQRANDVIRTLNIATGISAEKQAVIKAQARFLRAYFHMELALVFGHVIYADENVDLNHTDVTNTEDIWPKIEADLKAAADSLPESWPGEPGRANNWAAKAMLAKAYLHQTQPDYTSAYGLLKEILGPGFAASGVAAGMTAAGTNYKLLPHFYSNFNPAQKNSSESVFAAQTSVHDGSSVDWGGDPNGNYGDVLNFPYNGGPGACCGFYNPSQDLANAFKTDANGLPLLDESYATGPGSGAKNVSDPSDPYKGTLDPRIDWTMGRKGIPYLDWGLHPGDDWIRNPVNDGHFSPIKDVYAKSQKDAYSDVGSAYWGPTELTANNVNIIRFADVILWAAECAIKVDGDVTTAMNYVNMIRSRAMDPTGWVYKNSDYDASSATYKNQTTPADNYKIGLYTPATFTAANALTAIRFERRLELAMEGQRFFDLQRYDKESPGLMATVINRYISREKALRPLKQNAQFTAGKNEIFPIPQGEIDNMNADGKERLKQNPGY